MDRAPYREAWNADSAALSLFPAPRHWPTTVATPTQWACGEPTDPDGVLAFDPGTVRNVSDACYCHYTDLAPPPPPPCPHGSYSACVVACTDLPAGPDRDKCIAECERLCPH